MSYILLTWLLAPLWWPISLFRKLLTPQPNRILILEIAGIGDVVCTAHLLAQIKAQRPKARIDLMIDPVASSLAPALHMVERVIEFPYARQRGLMGRLRLARHCLAYDTVVCLIPSAAQLSAMCLAATPRRLTILPQPINLSYRLLSPLLTKVVEHVPGAYFPTTQASLLESLGLAPLSARKVLPVPEINRLSFGIKSVGVLVGSGRALKRLEVSQWCELISRLLAREPGLRVVLLGGPADQCIAQKILATLPASDRSMIMNITGRFSLAELPRALVSLSLLIGVDSGVTHMADALGTPLICLAGPVDLGEVYESGTRRALLTEPIPCHPCSRVFDTPSECHLGHRQCLKAINLERVVDLAIQMLGANLGR